MSEEPRDPPGEEPVLVDVDSSLESDHDAEPADGETAADVEDVGAPDEDVRPPRSAKARAFFAVTRAVVVLVVGGVVYQLVVPYNRPVPSRLANLVIKNPGLAQFSGVKPQAGIRDATQTGFPEMNSAAKKSPNQTGWYAIEWGQSSTDAAVIHAFVLPDQADAQTFVGQFKAKQLSATSYNSAGLKQASAGPVPGIPGSAGALYQPASKAAGTTSLAAVLFRRARVVSLIEVVAPNNAQAEARTLAQRQWVLLDKAAPGFTLTKVVRPSLSTKLWAAGTALLALIAALGPIGWRRLADARRRRQEEELAHQVLVGSQVIYKYRR